MLQTVAKKSQRGEGGAVHSELDDLQRKYRIMELNRQKYNEDSQNTIRMQRQQIDKLKKDNDRLKEDLALETRQAKQANTMSASAQIAKLQDQGDLYRRKIEVEKKRISQLDKEIKKVNDAILLQRKTMGGINASRDNNQHVQKEIRILENRLDKALVKFNEALAHNKALRETIDNLRRERVVFDGIYRKLERELQEKKNKMAQLIEISNTAYEARDQAQAEMVSLKGQADKEQQRFEEEWAQLGKLIESDRKMKDFMKGSTDSGATLEGADPTVEEELKLRKRVIKGAWGIAQDKATIHMSMEKVQQYEEAFAKIQKATEITDIDKLVQNFIEAEDKNFSLFNYVNDLSNDIQKLKEANKELEGEIVKYNGQGVTTDNQRKEILKDLQAQLGKTTQKSKNYEVKYSEAIQTVNALKTGIESIFKLIGCDDSAMNELLGNAGVTESNMMQYLGIIEQRVNSLLATYKEQRTQLGPDFKTIVSADAGALLPATQEVESKAVTIQAPSAAAAAGAGGGEYEDEDEDEAPISVPVHKAPHMQ